MIRRIGILTSGGDAPGMNAAIRAVTRVALANGFEVMGIKDGYRGLVEGNYIPMDKSTVSDILNRGGTVLGSARLTEFKDLEIQKKAVQTLQNAKSRSQRCRIPLPAAAPGRSVRRRRRAAAEKSPAMSADADSSDAKR